MAQEYYSFMSNCFFETLVIQVTLKVMHNVGGCIYFVLGVGSQNIVCTVCKFSLCLTLLWDVDNAANASQPRTWPSPRFYLRSCALVELIG